MLLGPHQDPPYFDVSDDEYVTALDVLQVINRLNLVDDDGLSGEQPETLVAEGEVSSFPGSAWERTGLPALPAGARRSLAASG